MMQRNQNKIKFNKFFNLRKQFGSKFQNLKEKSNQISIKLVDQNTWTQGKRRRKCSETRNAYDEELHVLPSVQGRNRSSGRAQDVSTSSLSSYTMEYNSQVAGQLNKWTAKQWDKSIY